jgi:serine/threonine protein kinase
MNSILDLVWGEWSEESLADLASQHIAFLGRYRFKGLLGAGTTGAVFRATDSILKRDVAVKVFSPRSLLRAVERDFESFQHEAQLLASLKHPNVCEVYDFGIAEGVLPWFAMELVDGDTLRACINRWSSDSSVEFSAILRLGSDVATAIDALQKTGIHQLDIKPENILITSRSEVKLIDFATGFERLDCSNRRGGYRFGTPEYLAPEIIHKALGPPSSPADIFSLGILLLELCCFSNPLDQMSLRAEACEALGIKAGLANVAHTSMAFPFEEYEALANHGKAYADAIAGIDIADLLRRSRFLIPDALNPLIARMLSIAPAPRPSAAEVATALQGLLNGAPTPTIFVSHCHGDKTRFADPFVKALVSRGVNVWYDSRNLRVGEPFWDRIGTALDRSEFVVVVLSKLSVRSSGVNEELRIARLQNLSRVKILPVVIDGLDINLLPPDLRARQILRFPLASAKRSFGIAVDDLIRQIRELASQSD